MKNILKKSISIIMSACMLMSATSASAVITDKPAVSYDDVFTSGNFVCMRNGISETANITGYIGETPDVLEIPSELNGYTITEISYEAHLGKGATEIILPDTLTVVDPWGISSSTVKKLTVNSRSIYFPWDSLYCHNLSEIVFTDNVKSICFGESCITSDALTTINIPDSTTNVAFSTYCFTNCKNITEINVPAESVTGGAYGLTYTKWYDNQPDGVVRLGNCVMEYKGIANNNMVLSIPEGSQRIADLAFNGMSSIVSVEFPDSLVNIGNGSFAGCENLKSLNIPKNVITIENDAFYYCTKLESVIISDGVKTIDDSAFYGCSSLKNIVIPASVTKIGKNAFGYESDWWFEKIDLCIYGFKNSAAEKYATENGLEFCSISYISTEGIVFTDENAQPEINKITDGEIFENTKTQLEEASLLAIYDIATNSDEKSMIKIPTKSPSIKLYFINADGTLSDTNAVYENGYLTLQNSNGGRFALTKIKKDINNDGIIDVKDVTILQMHLVGYSVGADVNNIDINQDGIIDINDVTNLQFILSNSDVASNPSR